MPEKSDRYELIPFDDSSLPVRVNFDSAVMPGKVSYSPKKCLWHEQIELLLPREGEISVYIGSKNVRALPGETVFVNPYEPHLVVSGDAPSRYDCVMIDSALYRKAARGTDSEKWLDLLSEGHVRFFNHIPRDEEVIFHADAICREMKERAPAFDLAVGAHVASLLVALFRRRLSGSGTPEQIAANAARYDRIKPAIELIKSDLALRRSLEELSGACHLSVSQFCRLFGQITGSTPLKFDADLRLREAAVLLRQTDLSVAEIAQRVGFDDAAYFARCFRRRFGTTPTEARWSAAK
ncbi:MAG: helix-turn-helix transcriptional regulator [Clostridia bacterium]|nr:helix-turn-helix transcriptional regulator [Clostridia bacterium]